MWLIHLNYVFLILSLNILFFSLMPLTEMGQKQKNLLVVLFINVYLQG